MSKKIFGLTCAVGVGLLTTNSIMAQSNGSSTEEEEIFELSPFEVDASQDTGYRATSTIAGSRLNTQLKDVAASVSVLTNEFLNDIGATNVEEALTFVVGAETGQDFEGSSGQSWVGGDQEVQPSRNRLRGLSQADVTNDFFSTSNPHFDTYNTQRVAVVRGPNSILFGLGSPSGIINHISKRASVNKDFGEARVVLDDHGTVRLEADLNHVLAEDKLATRLMVLSNDKGFQYDRAYDRDKRATIAFTYKPTEKTNIDLSYEEIDIKSRRPRYIVPMDQITRWAQAGSPTFDAGNVATDNLGSSVTIPNPETPPVDPSDYFADMGIVSAETGIFFTDMVNPGPAYAIRLRNRTTYGTTMSGSSNLFMQRSSDPDFERTFFTSPHVTDERVFPFTEVDLATLPGNWQTQESKRTKLIVTHAVNDDLDIEVGYFADRSVRENLAQITTRTAMIAVDVNETLTDGSANPNFMRPFVAGRGVGDSDDDQSESFRIQASYDLDLADKTDRSWLGRHRFAALFSKTRTEEFRYVWEPRIDAINHPAIEPNPNGNNRNFLDSTFRRASLIYYVGDAMAPGQMHPNYTGFPETELIRLGDPFGLTYFDQDFDTGTVDSNGDPILGGWVSTDEDEDVALGRIIHTQTSYGVSKNEGTGITMQSYFLDGKVVTTFGYRDDEVRGAVASGPLSDSNGQPPLDRNLWGLADVNSLEPEGDSTITKSVVAHPFGPTNWLSVHYNESENFVVVPPNVDILGRPVGNPSGVGKDYGFSLRLMEDKLNVKVNWFETVQQNSREGNLAFVAFWRMRGFERGIYSRIRNNADWIDSNGDRFTWVRWDGSDENHERFTNVTDVNDFSAEGVEIEMTYNPNPNWRFLFNASKQETIQSNTGLALLEYIELRSPFWDQFWDLPWSSSRTVREQYNAAVGGPLFPALSGDGKVSQGQAKWSANFVGNYKFTDGRFKGSAFGLSARWRDRRALGYGTTIVEGSEVTDITQPFFGPSSLNIGVHASYGKKIFNDTVDWKIQLNIQNLVGDDTLEPIRINPDGRESAFRVGRERIFRLTNTFKF